MFVDDNFFHHFGIEYILKENFDGLTIDKAMNGLEAVNLYKESLSQISEVSSSPSQMSQLPLANESPSLQYRLPYTYNIAGCPFSGIIVVAQKVHFFNLNPRQPNLKL